MRILVTGGTGYVGSNLVERLLNESHKVIVVSRSNANNSITPIVTYSGQIEELQVAFEDFSPDAVIHLAANVEKKVEQGNIDNLLAANIILPAHLLQLAKDFHVKNFINISTYSTSTNGKDYSPQTFYAGTKKAAEDLCSYYALREGLNIATLCLYDIYGPKHPHAKFLTACEKAIRNSSLLRMSPGEQEICFLYIKDAVDGIIHTLDLLNRNKIQGHEIYSLFGREVFQLKDIPQLLVSILGLDEVKLEHSLPYRSWEIMKVAQQYPLPPNWEPKTNFKDGVISIFGGDYEQ